MIHLYIGNGKGKTTAALGLAVRALGWKKKVLFCQFLKSAKTGETNIFSGLDCMKFYRPSMRNHGFLWEMDEEAVEETIEDLSIGLNEIKKFIQEENYSIIVLDEVLDAVQCGLLPEESILEIINSKDA
ncbi:MAG: cob(I)yrinic acid a,c-diamide adenosyltransferase, partial [Clostridiaceae bacterium]|nr:cob(I)yrinic acid a,c-diamide adenosyltransferase [Clostridiaceae bacterium]